MREKEKETRKRMREEGGKRSYEWMGEERKEKNAKRCKEVIRLIYKFCLLSRAPAKEKYQFEFLDMR